MTRVEDHGVSEPAHDVKRAEIDHEITIAERGAPFRQVDFGGAGCRCFVDERAHVLIRKMLQEPRVSAVIPGVNVPEQLEENVKGSYERGKPLDAKDKEALRQCTENYHACLTPEYHWLRQWETV